MGPGMFAHSVSEASSEARRGPCTSHSGLRGMRRRFFRSVLPPTTSLLLAGLLFFSIAGISDASLLSSDDLGVSSKTGLVFWATEAIPGTDAFIEDVRSAKKMGGVIIALNASPIELQAAIGDADARVTSGFVPPNWSTKVGSFFGRTPEGAPITGGLVFSEQVIGMTAQQQVESVLPFLERALSFSSPSELGGSREDGAVSGEASGSEWYFQGRDSWYYPLTYNGLLHGEVWIIQEVKRLMLDGDPNRD